MKIRYCREKVIVFMLSIILVMGMAACSLETSRETDSGSLGFNVEPTTNPEAATEPAASNPVTPTTQGTETPNTSETETSQPEDEERVTPKTTAPVAASEDIENEYSDEEETSVGDPIVGIVDKFADSIIVIKDAGDPDLVYYFSTQNAQVVEGDSPITAGDMVEITYRGVMGDEEHPGEAVKVVAESMMYQ